MKSSTIGVQLLFLLNFLVSVYGLYYYDLTLLHIALVLLGYFLYGCLGIVVTFHRLLTHKSYKTYNFIEKLFSILGCLGGTGSPLAWVSIHINHHLKSDRPDDPHSPKYKGWKIFFLNYENEVDKKTKWRMREMLTNPFQQFLHRYYFLVIVSWVMLLYAVGGFELIAFLFVIPATITGIMSNVVNYVSHKPNLIGGSRRYNLNDDSSNNWLFAIPTWGESWHNNHHRHPKNFSCGEKWWEIDISAFVIRLIKK